MAPMGWREWAALLVLSLLWGGSFFFIAVAVPEIPPVTLVAGRVGVAAIVLLILVASSGRALALDRRAILTLAVMGVINGFIPYTLISWGQTRLDSGSASILNATTPLFGVVLAHLFGREKLTIARGCGVTLGTLGVCVLIGPQAIAGLGKDLVAAGALLGSSFSYAIAAICGLRLRGMSPLVASAGQISFTAMLAIPVSIVVDQPWQLRPSVAAVAAVFAIALLSTVLGYILYFRVLAAAGATNALLVTFLIPPSAILLGFLFLGEHPGISAFIAMMLIFAGIALVDGRILRRKA